MLLEDELALVVRAQNGDRTALGELWDFITPKLHGYLVNTVRNPQLAEDLLQNTWLKAITAIHKFQPKGVRFSAWLFAIARNECRQHWRDHGQETSIEEADLEKIPETMTTHEKISEKIFLDTELNKLPEEHREILRLRYISEFSFKEIAQILSISTIAARVRVHRALGQMRTNLEKY